MKNILYFSIYFALSSVLTCWFVILCPLYVSDKQMLLSTCIAGGKWGIQIVLALLFLKEKALPFLRKIGFVCLIGSLLLVPFILSAYFNISNSGTFFFASLVVAVLIMIVAYYRAVKSLYIDLKWSFFWLLCLGIAIILQLTVVFHYF